MQQKRNCLLLLIVDGLRTFPEDSRKVDQHDVNVSDLVTQRMEAAR